MCLTITGRVIEIKDKNAVIDVMGRKSHVKINPSVPVEEGDRVVIFKNIILDKVSE